MVLEEEVLHACILVPECLVCRFDLMAGVNGQEGGLMYGFQVPMIAGMLNKSVENGVDMEIVNAILNMQCGAATPLSTELCVSFLKNLYKLEEPTSDRERAKRLIDMQGKASTTLSSDLCPDLLKGVVGQGSFSFHISQ